MKKLTFIIFILTGFSHLVALNCRADISVTVTKDKEVVSECALLSVITVTNNGHDDYDDVEVTYFNNGLFYDGDNGTFTTIYDSDTLVWDVGRLDNGTSKSLGIIFFMGRGSFTGEVALTDSFPVDPNPANNSDIITGQGCHLSDIAVTNTVSSLEGGVVAYEVIVTNNGPDDADGVRISENWGDDKLSFIDNATNLSLGSFTINASGSGGYWDIGELPFGKSETMMLTAQIIDNSTCIENAAGLDLLTILDSDWNENNNSASAFIGEESTDLSVFVTVDKLYAGSGDNATLTIRVINNRSDNATGVNVMGTVSSCCSNAFTDLKSDPETCDNSIGGEGSCFGTIRKWCGQTIPADSEAVFTSKISVNDNCTIKWKGQVSDRCRSYNDYTYDSIFINGPDISITKTSDKTEADVGEEITFAINVTNNGPNLWDNATGIRILEILPDGLSYVRDDSTGSYDRFSIPPLWNVGNLEKGSSKTLHITTRVDREGVFTNFAHLYAPNAKSRYDNKYSAYATVETTFATTTVPPTEGGGGGRGLPGPPENSLLLIPELVDMGSTKTLERLYITNATGLGLLKWNIEAVEYLQGNGWITIVNPLSGSTTNKNKVLIAVSRSGLNPGIYEALLPIVSNSGSGKARVRMEVLEEEEDLPAPIPEPECVTDADCQDSIFCNGEEQCVKDKCFDGVAPCEEDAICMEDMSDCWVYEKLHVLSLKKKLLRPSVSSKRCPWLVLKSEGKDNFNKTQSVITITGPEEKSQGVTLDSSRSPSKISGFIMVPICIEKDATVGLWSVEIETDIEDAVNPFREVIDASFVIQ